MRICYPRADMYYSHDITSFSLALSVHIFQILFSFILSQMKH